MKFLFRYIRPFVRIMLVGLSVKVFGTLVELALPYILGYILDEVAPNGGQVKDILLWGGGMVVCAFLALVCNIKANRD